MTPENVELVRHLKPVADRLGLTRAQLALVWLLRQPGVSSVMTGATRVSQVEDNAGAGEVELPEEVAKQIHQILSDVETETK